MKFIVVVDPHFSSEAPHSRKDDYAETMFRKLAFIRETASREKVRAVIFTGDFSHKKTQPTPYVIRMIEELQEFICPCFSIIGNHDVYAANPEFVNKTFLGILFAAGALNPLRAEWFEDDTEKVLEGQRKVSVLFKGYDFAPRLLVAPDALSDREKRAQYKVAVTHAFLVKEQAGFTTDDVLDVTSFASAGFDVMFAGHDHVEYPPLVIPAGDGSSRSMTVFRCGALSRGTKHFYQRTRTPKACLIDFQRDNVFYTSIDVPCEDANLVFLPPQMEREQLANKMKAFVESLKVRKEGALDIFDSLLKVCHDEVVLQCCFRYLETNGFSRRNDVPAGS